KAAGGSDSNVAPPVGDEHVLRGRPEISPHRPLKLVDIAGLRRLLKRLRLVRTLEHRPSHRQPEAALVAHGAAVSRVDRVPGDGLALPATIGLDTLLERMPGTVHLVLRRMAGVVDRLGIENEDVGTGVRTDP